MYMHNDKKPAGYRTMDEAIALLGVAGFTIIAADDPLLRDVDSVFLERKIGRDEQMAKVNKEGRYFVGSVYKQLKGY